MGQLGRKEGLFFFIHDKDVLKLQRLLSRRVQIFILENFVMRFINLFKTYFMFCRHYIYTRKNILILIGRDHCIFSNTAQPKKISLGLSTVYYA